MTAASLPAAAFNLRDMGGYATARGGRVKRGLLYRSGTMSGLDAEGEAAMAALGIASVCDLRHQRERTAEPTRWCGPVGVWVWSSDAEQAASGILDAFAEGEAPTEETLRAAMTALYTRLADDHAPAYRAMFDRLLGGHVPLLVNCAAGKDRTGVAAALVLHALEVPWETIVEDYLRTNEADLAAMILERDGEWSDWVRTHAGAAAPLFAADRVYLETMRETLDARHGGLDGYLASIGVDAAAKARLRALLVE